MSALQSDQPGRSPRRGTGRSLGRACRDHQSSHYPLSDPGPDECGTCSEPLCHSASLLLERRDVNLLLGRITLPRFAGLVNVLEDVTSGTIEGRIELLLELRRILQSLQNIGCAAVDLHIFVSLSEILVVFGNRFGCVGLLVSELPVGISELLQLNRCSVHPLCRGTPVRRLRSVWRRYPPFSGDQPILEAVRSRPD
jgi:hypothetical protein